MAMLASAQDTTHSTSESDSAAMEAIEALKQRADALGDSADFWGNWSQGFGVAIALLTLALAAVGMLAYSRSREQSQVQDELIKAKDEHLARELKAKDVSIAAAGKAAELAHESAATANARAEASALEAAKANEGLAKANLEIENRKQENLKLLQDIENEKHGGAQMLAAMSPRHIQWSEWAGTYLEPLKKLKNQKVIIEYIPEGEPRRAAVSLAQELRTAGWDVEGPNENADLWFHAGVRVEQYIKQNMGNITDYSERQKESEALMASSRAARSLIAFLKHRRWQEVNNGGHDDKLPLGAIRVQIGTKPDPRIPQKPIPGTGDYTQRLIDEGEDVAVDVPLARAEQRIITPKQFEIAKEILIVERKSYDDMFGKIVPVEIRCPAGNGEALRYAEQFAGLLTESGWEVEGGSVIVDVSFNRKLTGVVVRADDTDTDGQEFFERGSLFWAFDKAGIEVRDLMTQPTLHPPQILVGW